jgi:hypothetical protein
MRTLAAICVTALMSCAALAQSQPTLSWHVVDPASMDKSVDPCVDLERVEDPPRLSEWLALRHESDRPAWDVRMIAAYLELTTAPMSGLPTIRTGLTSWFSEVGFGKHWPTCLV